MDDRSGDHLAAKEILVAGRVGRLLVWVLVVHRAADGEASVGGQTGHGVEVRHEPIPPVEGFFGRLERLLGVFPGPTLGARVFGGVQSQAGA